jgi:hypothetical protein
MSHSFLQYWKSAQVKYELSVGRALKHSGSGQLNKVKTGDTVWIVTVMPPGELFTVGRIKVSDVFGYTEAKRRFTDNVWKAKYHIAAEPGTEENLRLLNLMRIAGELRFQSPTNDRLIISRGHVKAQQLQAMRKLSPASALLLEAEWYSTDLPSTSEIEQQIRVGAGFGNPETNRKVERAAIVCVTDWYKSHGWDIRSVEAEKCGYDLHCVKGSAEEHVEVKGVKGTGMSFIITAGEVRRAQVDPSFIICIVNSALSIKPQISRYSGRDLIDKFDLDELAFRARLRT